MKRDRVWLLISSLLVLLVLNGLIVQKERILRQGRTIFLQLAPRDPRSLMQGDYMALRYRIADEASAREAGPGAPRDKLVVRPDAAGVASFVRWHDGSEPAEGELLLSCRFRRGRLLLGAESFFFEEGQSGLYQTARYGQLALAGDGSSILIGLADEQLRLLGQNSGR